MSHLFLLLPLLCGLLLIDGIVKRYLLGVCGFKFVAKLGKSIAALKLLP